MPSLAFRGLEMDESGRVAQMNWVDYWNGKPTIYVSDRHQEAHDLNNALSIIRFIRSQSATVLDYGCGDATRAQLIANRCARLLLWDAAPAVRDRLTERYSSYAGISVLAPDALDAIEPGSVDLITTISVVQYLNDEALSQTLQRFRRLLRPDGVLVIGDVIPPGLGPHHDAWELLSFAYHEGFLVQAGVGLVKTALSPYARVRSRLKLAKYSETEFLDALAAHGFAAHRLSSNIGHNQQRMAFEARLSPAPKGANSLTGGLHDQASA